MPNGDGVTDGLVDNVVDGHADGLTGSRAWRARREETGAIDFERRVAWRVEHQGRALGRALDAHEDADGCARGFVEGHATRRRPRRLSRIWRWSHRWLGHSQMLAEAAGSVYPAARALMQHGGQLQWRRKSMHVEVSREYMPARRGGVSEDHHLNGPQVQKVQPDDTEHVEERQDEPLF